MSLYEIIYVITNIIYIFTTSIFFQVFFEDAKCNLKLKRVTLSLYYIVLSLSVFITRIPIIMLFINIAFLLLISLAYKSSFQKKIISISFIYAIGMLIEVVAANAFGFFELSGLEDGAFNSISVLILIRVITLVVVYTLSRFKNAWGKEYKIPKIYYGAFFIVLFGTLYLFIAQLTNDDSAIYHIIISGSILIVVNVTMITVDEKIYRSIIIENERNILNIQNESLQNQMEIINQSTEAMKILKHDFKDHLIMLSHLYKDNRHDEVEVYVNNILGNIENEAFANSNNFIIDSVLNFKLGSIKNDDIKLQLDINVPISLNILAHDLTTVLANLLDNAIAACKVSTEKMLHIKISSNMGNLIILITNSYDGKIIAEGSVFKTTKQYKSNHGLGLISVKKILEKYDGEIRIDYTCNVFSVSAIIPY